MNAVFLHTFGGPECLRSQDAPPPQIRADEVLIQVKAAGVNPVDAKLRAGEFARFHPVLPAVIGRDASGTVIRVGEDVSGLAEGDEVFGLLDYDRGAYAEQVAASPREIVPKPAGVDHVTAAALPVAALTAWQALFEQGRLQPGQRVLIHGGAGGVGHLAVQLAVWKGAEVASTCSKKDIDFVRGLGASMVIDYQAQRFEDEVRGLDLVIDLLAGETRERSWQTLRAAGILVSTLPSPKPPPRRPDLGGREVVAYMNAEQLQTIAGLVERGEIKVTINRTFALAEAGAAHRHLKEAHAPGKTVLRLD